MESFDRHKPRSATYFSEGSGESEHRSHSSKRSHRKEKTPLSHKICDGITEGLIYWMIIFTPWAFGTTQNWSIWTANISAYLIGSLLIAKWFIRWRTGYQPERWDANSVGDKTLSVQNTSRLQRYLTFTLASLTIFILFYCAISALNPRAIYLPRQNRFEYQDYIHWLPHSYDPARTWFVFSQYLGLAWFFWAAREWLLTKTTTHSPKNQSSILSARLQRLLWLLSVNGAILALEAILQRLDGTSKLLWIVEPRLNRSPDFLFGPYAYRSNAATYFNLVWPLCLGLWLSVRKKLRSVQSQKNRLGQGSHLILLPITALIAASPIISTSRGGALIAFANIFLAAGVVFWSERREHSAARLGYALFFVIVFGFAGYLGWEKLASRLKTVFTDQLSMRTTIYKNAQQLTEDFSVFGTGPGTFSTVYQLYKSPTDEWAAYAHNDWLEARITFGRAGLTLILGAMLCVSILQLLVLKNAKSSWPLTLCLFISLMGCLIHARFDFPFQIYSLFATFVLVCSILISLPTEQHFPGNEHRWGQFL